MSVLVKGLVQSKEAESAKTAQYTCGVQSTIIDQFTVTNTTVAALDISVWLGAQILKDVSIPADGKATPIYGLIGHTMNKDEILETQASAAGLIIRVSGREVS